MSTAKQHSSAAIAISRNTFNNPKGFVSKRYPRKVFDLAKSLYGLKPAPRIWYILLCNVIESLAFTSPEIDNNLLSLSQPWKRNIGPCLRCICEAIAISQFYSEFTLKIPHPTLLSDNGASEDHINYQRVKHINIRYHFVRHALHSNQIAY